VLRKKSHQAPTGLERSPTMPPIVEARNLKKTFGAFTAVKDVSF
jgi:hypothetical protein